MKWGLFKGEHFLKNWTSRQKQGFWSFLVAMGVAISAVVGLNKPATNQTVFEVNNPTAFQLYEEPHEKKKRDRAPAALEIEPTSQ